MSGHSRCRDVASYVTGLEDNNQKKTCGLEKGEKQGGKTSTQCEKQNQPSNSQNIQFSEICSLSQSSGRYYSSVASMFWGRLPPEGSIIAENPGSLTAYKMISQLEAEGTSVNSDIIVISSDESDCEGTATESQIPDHKPISQPSSSGANSDRRNPIPGEQERYSHITSQLPELIQQFPYGVHSLEYKHDLVKSPQGKGTAVMNQRDCPEEDLGSVSDLDADALIEQFRNEYESLFGKDKSVHAVHGAADSDNQSKGNKEERTQQNTSSKRFCCILSFAKYVNGKQLQCSCTSAKEMLTFAPTTQSDLDQVTSPSSSVSHLATELHTSTKELNKTDASKPTDQLTREEHGQLGLRPENTRQLSDKSMKLTQKKQEVETKTGSPVSHLHSGPEPSKDYCTFVKEDDEKTSSAKQDIQCVNELFRETEEHVQLGLHPENKHDLSDESKKKRKTKPNIRGDRIKTTSPARRRKSQTPELFQGNIPLEQILRPIISPMSERKNTRISNKRKANRINSKETVQHTEDLQFQLEKVESRTSDVMIRTLDMVKNFTSPGSVMNTAEENQQIPYKKNIVMWIKRSSYRFPKDRMMSTLTGDSDLGLQTNSSLVRHPDTGSEATKDDCSLLPEINDKSSVGHRDTKPNDQLLVEPPLIKHGLPRKNKSPYTFTVTRQSDLGLELKTGSAVSLLVTGSEASKDECALVKEDDKTSVGNRGTKSNNQLSIELPLKKRSHPRKNESSYTGTVTRDSARDLELETGSPASLLVSGPEPSKDDCTFDKENHDKTSVGNRDTECIDGQAQLEEHGQLGLHPESNHLSAMSKKNTRKKRKEYIPEDRSSTCPARRKKSHKPELTKKNIPSEKTIETFSSPILGLKNSGTCNKSKVGIKGDTQDIEAKTGSAVSQLDSGPEPSKYDCTLVKEDHKTVAKQDTEYIDRVPREPKQEEHSQLEIQNENKHELRAKSMKKTQKKTYNAGSTARPTRRRKSPKPILSEQNVPSEETLETLSSPKPKLKKLRIRNKIKIASKEDTRDMNTSHLENAEAPTSDSSDSTLMLCPVPSDNKTYLKRCYIKLHRLPLPLEGPSQMSCDARETAKGKKLKPQRKIKKRNVAQMENRSFSKKNPDN